MVNYYYDVALSFAGEDRDYVEKIATILKSLKINVFYDNFEQEMLWGKNLYTYLYDLYKDKAMYCVMFISKHYKEKLWTNHERKAIQERIFSEFDSDYLLPVRLDDTEIDGVGRTIGFVENKTAEELAYMIAKKLDKDLDINIMLRSLQNMLGNDYNINIEGGEVCFVNESENFEAQYPVSVLLEMHKYGLLEHMFIGPAIVPN